MREDLYVILLYTLYGVSVAVQFGVLLRRGYNNTQGRKQGGFSFRRIFFFFNSFFGYSVAGDFFYFSTQCDSVLFIYLCSFFFFV